MSPEQQRTNNLRLAWVLAAIVALLFVGFVVKSAIYGI